MPFLFYQVGVFSPSTRSHYLNITPNNVVRFYTKLPDYCELSFGVFFLHFFVYFLTIIGGILISTVFLFYQVGVFSPSTRSHYLNITPNNVVRFYTKLPDSGELSTETLGKFVASDFKPPELESKPASPATNGEFVCFVVVVLLFFFTLPFFLNFRCPSPFLFFLFYSYEPPLFAPCVQAMYRNSRQVCLGRL